MSFIQANRELTISTPSLGDDDVFILHSFTMEEELGRPFTIEAELLSENANINFDDIVGQSVTIKILIDGGDGERFLNGVVAKFSQSGIKGRLSQYSATIVPTIWLLSRRMDCRIFQKMTIPDIIKKVFRDANLSEFEDGGLSAPYSPTEYTVQYAETDFDFVSRLMENEGIYYYFTHTNGAHKLHLVDDTATHNPYDGHDTFTFLPSSNELAQPEHISSWVREVEVQAGSYALKDFDFEVPKKNLAHSRKVQRAHAAADNEMYEYPGGYTANSDGDRYSKVRIQEEQASYVEITAESDLRSVNVGCTFMLDQHPRNDQNKKYLITSLEWSMVAPGIQSKKNDKDDEDESDEVESKCSFTAMDAEEYFRLSRDTPATRIEGPQTAIVVGEGGTIWVDKYGRVKIQFHWDRNGTSDDNSSCWCRVSQGWAGKSKNGFGWGDMAIPHVGDEVIVDFLEGDPDQPIIVGRVYNADNMPPLELPINKDKRIWRDDFGNEMIFDATEGDEHIRLYSPHHKSLLSLGKSVLWTSQSNIGTKTTGQNISIVLGANSSVVAGANLQATAGVAATANVGAIYNINIGGQFNFSAGFKYDYNWDARSNVSTNNANSVSEQDMVVAAHGALCLAGGCGQTGAHPDISVITVSGEEAAIEVGGKVPPTAPSTHAAIKAMGAIAAAFPAAAVAAAMVSLNCDDDWAVSSSWSTPSQHPSETVAEALAAAALVATAAMWAMAKKYSTTTKTIPPDDTAMGRFKMLSETGAATLHSLEFVEVAAKATLSDIDNLAGIKLDNTGLVKIKSTGNIDLETKAEFKLKASNVSVNNGALTIAG